MVSITEYHEDDMCGFCRKESREGVQCAFDDGSFEGFLCLADFRKFLRLKLLRPRSPAAPRPNGKEVRR